MSSVIFNQVHQPSSGKKVPTKKNVICKHFNHNCCKFSKQCKFLHICRNFISGSCCSVKCSFDHVKLCPVLACNNIYCSFAHAPHVGDLNSPPSGPLPLSLSTDKDCKSHSSPFPRPILVHRTQAKISHQSSSGTAQKMTNPSRSRTLLPYPLLPPPPPAYRSPISSPLTVCCFLTLPQTSNFLMDMNHYSQPAPLSQHITKPHPQPIRFIPRAYPVNVTEVWNFLHSIIVL